MTDTHTFGSMGYHSGLGLSGEKWVGVVDIGSNTIRIVVYSRQARAPVVIHNEKVLCALGKTVQKTGNLNPQGVTLALRNLARFRHLADAMGLARLDVIATAAVRDAADGAEFVERVRRECGLNITVISGEEEARLSALGVLSGTPSAHGVMGDLGGGSLELVGIDNHAICEMATTPLGSLRLMGGEGDRAAMTEEIDRHLTALPWLDKYHGQQFYPVGGSWRSIAKALMDRDGHPIHIVHDYEVPGPAALDMAIRLARASKSDLEKQAGISRRRRDIMPIAALTLERVLRKLEPRTVVFSAFGLREGILFDRLPADEQAKDPLIDAAAQLETAVGRFGHGEIIANWIGALFPGEEERAHRLRLAACMLSDIGWFEHPDYRAEHAFLRILRMPFAALSHPERAQLALSIFVRYAGTLNDAILRPIRALLTDRQAENTLILGLALRLAHYLTGGAPRLLRSARLDLDDAALTLVLPPSEEVLVGESVETRLQALADALGRKAVVRITAD
jgi:exopolyphosphatase / guanosine-5'-triphosphate,3'-diphosphate pyrophosphatase